MIWVATQAIAALVVDLFLTWHIAIEVHEHRDVSSHCLSIQRHSTITTTSTSTTGWSCPVPTTCILVDLHTFHDLIKDRLASVCDGGKFHGLYSNFIFAAELASCRTKSEHGLTLKVVVKLTSQSGVLRRKSPLLESKSQT